MKRKCAKRKKLPELEFREGSPGEYGRIIAFTSRMFGHVNRQVWEACRTRVGVALHGDEIFGAIPFSIRRFKIRPDVSVPVAFEYAVGVREDVRDCGIGTRIMDAAAGFLADRCDAMMVYRGGERTPGYRFYRKSGHSDVRWVRQLALDPPGAGEGSVEVRPIGHAVKIERELLPLFQRTYGRYAGYPVRRRGYWRRAIASRPGERGNARLLTLGKARVRAYAAIALPRDKAGGNVEVFEVAGRRADVRPLLEVVAHVAAQREAAVVIPAEPGAPFYDLYLDYGFRESSRRLSTMARVLRPGSLFRRIVAGDEALRDVEILAATPHRDVVLQRPRRRRASAGSVESRSITLEMKEDGLARLLLCRLDLAAALREERVTVFPREADLIAALCRIFRPAPWVYLQTDYV